MDRYRMEPAYEALGTERVRARNTSNGQKVVSSGERQQRVPWYIREGSAGQLMRRELLVRWVATSGRRGVVALCAREVR